MLIDLEFSLDHTRKKKRFRKSIVDFDTTNGGLITTTTNHSKQPFKRVVAVRLGKGVYWGYDLHETIQDFTNEELDRNEGKAIWEKMVKLHDVNDIEEKNKLRLEFSRWSSVPHTGVSDNIKQIFKRCHRYITSPNKYVLGVVLATQESDPNWAWHKHGVYIGDHRFYGKMLKDSPEIESLWKFTFYKLK